MKKKVIYNTLEYKMPIGLCTKATDMMIKCATLVLMTMSQRNRCTIIRINYRKKMCFQIILFCLKNTYPKNVFLHEKLHRISTNIP